MERGKVGRHKLKVAKMTRGNERGENRRKEGRKERRGGIVAAVIVGR
jgi:hypothetical protein